MTLADASSETRLRPAPHPLDPLDADEIRRAAALVRAERPLASAVRFVAISLQEPDKDELEACAGGAAPERRALVVLLDKADGATYEAVVALEPGVVRSFRRVPGVQPPFMPEEWAELVRAVKAHPGYRAALARRGVVDLDLVSVDPVPAGDWSGQDGGGRRLARATSFVRSRPGGNPHARHVEGLVALVDLNAMEVVALEDREPVPLPPDPGEYEAGRAGPLRTDLRPLELVQPEGPSFTVTGNEVAWQRWRFRVGFDLREGLVLHTVGYEDGGRVRPVLHRASYTEIAVTYGDATDNHWFMSFFDMGELQPGALANSLELGCDCLGEIRYLDAVVSDAAGEPVTIRNAICLHEEDDGLLWKHVTESGVEVRRSRRLVVSWIATLGNYEYAFYWRFYLDGTIEAEVRLTGILQTAVLREGERPTCGELVAPRVNAMSHQHLFNVRLDFDLDGRANSVYELESAPIPLGPDNPHGTAFRTTARLLARESEAQRLVDPLAARSWKIVNPSVRNAVGEPVGYRLVPGDSVRMLCQPESPFGARAGFARSHLWVTPYAPGERYAAGAYPYQGRGDDGLPAWTSADRPLEDTDVVVWYTFGHHHVPRPEDWPVMPVARAGFTLKAAGFFDRNPALDVPPPAGGHCHHGS